MTQVQSAQIASGHPRSNNGLVLWQAINAGLSYVSAAATMSGVIPIRWAALLFMLAGGLQAGTAAYIAGVKPVQTPVEVVTVDLHRP